MGSNLIKSLLSNIIGTRLHDWAKAINSQITKAALEETVTLMLSIELLLEAYPWGMLLLSIR